MFSYRLQWCLSVFTYLSAELTCLKQPSPLTEHLLQTLSNQRDALQQDVRALATQRDMLQVIIIWIEGDIW